MKLARVIGAVIFSLIAPLLVGVSSAPSAHADMTYFSQVFSGVGLGSFGMSANGQYQIVTRGGDAYLSTNYGANFSNVKSISGYLSGAMSSDGSKMVIATEGPTDGSGKPTAGSLFMSTDFGTTWTEKTGAASKAWLQVKISDDGTKLIGIVDPTTALNRTGLYYSTNSGTSWTEYQVSGAAWNSIRISSSGSTMWASNPDSSTNNQGIYLSTNSGTTWTRKSSSTANGQCSLAINATGSTVYFAAGNTLYRSTDTGTTFTSVSTMPAPAYDNGQTKYQLLCVSISANSQKIILGGNNEYVQMSADTGTSWTMSYLDQTFGQTHYTVGWVGTVMSGDGSMVAVDAFDALYEYQFLLPSAVQNFTASVTSNTSLAISWSAPSTSGDAALSNYQVETSTNGTVWNLIKRSDTTTASLSQTGLTQGTTYYYRITPANKWGLGASYTSRAYVPGPLPRAQSAIVTTPGDSQIGLSWTSPTETSPVRTYVVEYSSNSGSTYSTFAHADSTSPSITVTGLTNGTSYLFRISATNDAGTGPTIVSSAAIPKTVPDAPTSVTGTSTTTVINLSWSAPGNNGGSAITDYVIRYSSDGGSSWATYTDSVTAAETATVGGLTNGVTYYFRVAAKNVVGTGNESANSSAIMLMDIGPATIALSLPGGVKVANKSTVIVITATTSQEGVVVFYLGAKKIPGCVSRLTTSKTATCSWRPPIHGSATLRASLKPTNTYYAMVYSPILSITINSRIGAR